MSASCLRIVLRLRMGCHGLPWDSDSWAGVPRVDRIRRFCGAGSKPIESLRGLGDERHLVY